MKLKHSMLGASIALALAATPLLAQTNTASNVLASLDTAEAPRITAPINNSEVVRIPNTHLTMAVAPSSAIPDTAAMNHLQLILTPSAQRQAALKQLIAEQHDPQSPGFHQWITPEQYGENFGVADADIATVTAWLTSQGFTVNNVYPNKTEIDFSGTAGQVRAAFHTQENLYTYQPVGPATTGSTPAAITHLSNNSDISIPAALQGVVAGVMGLNNFNVQTQSTAPTGEQVKWNAATHSYQPVPADAIHRQQFLQQVAQLGKSTGGKAQTVTIPGYDTRILTPFDMNQIYDANALRKTGITGKGVTIAVVENLDMAEADWTNFVDTFNLAQYGGTFTQLNPAPASGTNNCLDPNAVMGFAYDDFGTGADAEWATAMAPGANMVVASCSDVDANNNPTTSNVFGGVYIAAANLVNESTGRPNIISASQSWGEFLTTNADKTAIDAMWAQADSEGISVFVYTGSNGGSSLAINSISINGSVGTSGVNNVNALATSPDDTAVGATDLADQLDGTTSKYFASAPNAYGGSALGYVPEIPWNMSCGNGIAAASFGFSDSLALCQAYLQIPTGEEEDYVNSYGGSGGRSIVDTKPAWQSNVYDTAPDGMRDIPDVAVYGGSWANQTMVISCWYAGCALNSSGQMTSIGFPFNSKSSPVFAGIQALVDQALGSNGVPANQGNAAPTLYALAQQEYGTATAPNDAGLSNCASLDNGNHGNNGCVFHNIVRGDIATNCIQPVSGPWATANCYYYGVFAGGTYKVGLTSVLAAPTTYSLTNRAYTTRPGYSLASGLGSVDVANLVAAWKNYAASASTQP